MNKPKHIKEILEDILGKLDIYWENKFENELIGFKLLTDSARKDNERRSEMTTDNQLNKKIIQPFSGETIEEIAFRESVQPLFIELETRNKELEARSLALEYRVKELEGSLVDETLEGVEELLKMNENKLINPVTGKPYAVGDVLRNYAEAGVLMDAWDFKYRYGDGLIPFWWMDVDGQVGDYIAFDSHRFPLTILAVPPTPKPEAVRGD